MSRKNKKVVDLTAPQLDEKLLIRPAELFRNARPLKAHSAVQPQT